MEDRWLGYAKKLQAIASTGLHFGARQYDKERYAEIGAIAHQMLSDLATVPVERITDLVPDYSQGYATPKVDVRGAVIQDNKILLVQERSDQLWTLPGGYADVGISAGENVAKEILEEANIEVEVQQLIAVRHKARHAFKADARDFYKFYFLCAASADCTPGAGLETMNAGFFGVDELPELSTGRVIADDIHMAFEYHRHPHLPTFFD